VLAEHLVDVDNVGSCFRNARAFGAAAVLLDERCPDPLYRKAVRTSLGMVLEVPWTQAPFPALLDGLEAAGVATVGLTPDGKSSVSVSEVVGGFTANAPIALLVGNEAHGLSPEARARCTHLARIPMAAGADSLNVATALAVALYEWQVGRCR
jgi:tRNA G18 (ribose-2'-O)-methylase SpoU